MGYTLNSKIAAFGETKSVRDWASDDRCRVNKYTLMTRLKRGWDVEKALSRPPTPKHGPRKT